VGGAETVELSQPWSDLPTDLGATQPTGLEKMDLITAVNVRVNTE
jgi:hypothetical protein